MRQDLEGIARLGFTDDGFEVYINTDDKGDVPHFHYRTKETWEFHSCIRLDRAEYFKHEGKEGKLSKHQKEMLVEFLSSLDKNEDNRTCWQVLLREWNRNNQNIKIDENTKMPNY